MDAQDKKISAQQQINENEMTKIKDTGSAKNAEAVAKIKKEDLIMKSDFEDNQKKLMSMNNKYIDLKKT